MEKPLDPHEVMRKAAQTERKYGEVAKILMESRIHGHFRYNANAHGTEYYLMGRLLKHPNKVARVAENLIDDLPTDIRNSIEVVAGPVTGGVILGSHFASVLNGKIPESRPTITFAPIHYNEEEGYLLRPEWEKEVVGKNVLFIDDTKHIGQTAALCVDLLQLASANVVGAVYILRIGKGLRLPVPEFEALLFGATVTYEPSVCPECKRKVPITRF